MTSPSSDGYTMKSYFSGGGLVFECINVSSKSRKTVFLDGLIEGGRVLTLCWGSGLRVESHCFCGWTKIS